MWQIRHHACIRKYKYVCTFLVSGHFKHLTNHGWEFARTFVVLLSCSCQSTTVEAHHYAAKLRT